MKKAFTLAETLITMGIIGIIAVISIQNLSRDSNDAEMHARFLSTLNTMDAALSATQEIKGITFEADTDDFFSRLKLKKDCGTGNTGCWFTSNGSEIYQKLASNTRFRKVILSSGAAIACRSDHLATCYIDLDGPNKGINELGNDIFALQLMPPQENFSTFDNDFVLSGNFTTNSSLPKEYAFSTWFLLKQNRDYLKLNSSDKCKNGNQLSWDDPAKKTCK